MAEVIELLWGGPETLIVISSDLSHYLPYAEAQMDARRENEATPMKNRTEVEQKSERELVVTRTVNAPKHLVFDAWTKAEVFRSVCRRCPGSIRGHHSTSVVHSAVW